MTPTLAGRARRLLTGVAAVALALLFVAAPAKAEGPIADTYVFDGEVTAQGLLKATQTITFAAAPDELVQKLALSAPIDEFRSYSYEITNVAATIGGEKTEPDVSKQGDYLVVKVKTAGAANKPITLSYEVSGTTREERGTGGVLTMFTWRVLQGLNVEVKDTSGTIAVPAIASMVDCVAGPPGAVGKCDLFAAGTKESPMPMFESSNRGIGEQVTVSVGVPGQQIAATAVIREAWNLDRAFEVSLWTVLAAMAALALGGFGLYWLFKRTGLDVDTGGEFNTIATFRPVAAGNSTFELSDGVRPGHVGTVADERVDPVDVTASILDLAVRGHIVITELPRVVGEVHDWTLARVGSADVLAAFEERLLDGVAPAGTVTRVSTLPTTLTPALAGVQDALYDDVVAKGWFESRPDQIRSNWRRLGQIGIGVALVAAILLVAFTNLGLLALVLVLLAVGLYWVADRMPRRTKEGAKMLAGLKALAMLLATYPTTEMPRDRQLQELSKLLPYAVVLGGKERWLSAMAIAGDDAIPDEGEVGWYRAPEGWTLAELPASLTEFVNTVQGVLFSR